MGGEGDAQELGALAVGGCGRPAPARPPAARPRRRRRGRSRLLPPPRRWWPRAESGGRTSPAGRAVSSATSDRRRSPARTASLAVVSGINSARFEPCQARTSWRRTEWRSRRATRASRVSASGDVGPASMRSTARDRKPPARRTRATSSSSRKLKAAASSTGRSLIVRSRGESLAAGSPARVRPASLRPYRPRSPLLHRRPRCGYDRCAWRGTRQHRRR